MSEYGLRKFNDGQQWINYGYASDLLLEKQHVLAADDCGYEYHLAINFYRDPNNWTEAAAEGQDDFLQHKKAVIDYLLCNDDYKDVSSQGHEIFTAFGHLELTQEGYYAEPYTRKENNRYQHESQLIVHLKPTTPFERLKAFIMDLQHFLESIGVERASKPLDTNFMVKGAPNVSLNLAVAKGCRINLDLLKKQPILTAYRMVVEDTNMYALLAKDGDGQIRDTEGDAINDLLWYGYQQIADKRRATAKDLAWCVACQKFAMACRHMSEPVDESMVETIKAFASRALKRSQRGADEVDQLFSAVLEQVPSLMKLITALPERIAEYMENLFSTVAAAQSHGMQQQKIEEDKDYYEALRALSKDMIESSF